MGNFYFTGPIMNESLNENERNPKGKRNRATIERIHSIDRKTAGKSWY